VVHGYLLDDVLECVQIWVCRAGASPLHPTKELFEKSSLESQKLSKNIDKYDFLKVLEGGLGGTSFKKFLPVALSSLPDKLQFILPQHRQM
jgi:hypothetical protein